MNNRKCFSTALKCTFVAFVLLAFGSLVFAVYGTFPLSGAEMKLTSSHTTATTGDTITFTLTLPYPVTGTIVSAGIRVADWYNLPSEYELTRVSDLVYEFSYTVRGRTAGRMRARADVFTEDVENDHFDWLISNTIDFNVIPRMDTLWGMEISDRVIVITAGSERQINVLGAFEDGFDRLITEGFMGTTYEITGDPGIATISEDGRLIALKPGEGTLIARNGDISATAEIFISQSPSYWFFIEPTPDPDPEPELGPNTGDNGTNGNNDDGSEGRRRNRRWYGCNTIAGGAFMLLVLFPFLKKKK